MLSVETPASSQRTDGVDRTRAKALDGVVAAVMGAAETAEVLGRVGASFGSATARRMAGGTVAAATVRQVARHPMERVSSTETEARAAPR